MSCTLFVPACWPRGLVTSHSPTQKSNWRYSGRVLQGEGGGVCGGAGVVVCARAAPGRKVAQTRRRRSGRRARLSACEVIGVGSFKVFPGRTAARRVSGEMRRAAGLDAPEARALQCSRDEFFRRTNRRTEVRKVGRRGARA